MKKIEFKVSGMKCSGCSNKIKSGLEIIPGASNIFSSHEKQQVIVEFDEKLAKSFDFKIKIEELGFKVLSMKKSL